MKLTKTVNVTLTNDDIAEAIKNYLAQHNINVETKDLIKTIDKNLTIDITVNGDTNVKTENADDAKLKNLNDFIEGKAIIQLSDDNDTNEFNINLLLSKYRFAFNEYFAFSIKRFNLESASSYALKYNSAFKTLTVCNVKFYTETYDLKLLQYSDIL